MAWPYRGYNRIINTYQQYYAAPCLNSYSTLKNDIDQRIDDFYNTKNKDIYNEWSKLYRYIREKNASLKHCVDNGYIKSDLNEDEKIKNFRTICDKKRICHINVESIIHKNLSSKRTGKVEPCRGKNCKTETAEKVKLPSQLEGESSKATRLQRPKVQSISREHAGGEESNKQNEFLPAQSDVKVRPNSIKSEVHEQESVNNKESSTSVKGSTSTQAFPDAGDTPPKELNLHAEDSPSKISFTGESDAGGTLQVSNSGISLLQGNLSDNQTLDANRHNMQTHQGGVENQDNSHEIVVTQLSDRVSTLGSVSAFEKLDDEGSVYKDNIRAGDKDVSHDLEAATHLDIKNEGVVSVPTEVVVSSGDASFSRETYSDEALSVGFVDGEGATNAGVLNAEKVNEIDANNGNILHTLSEFFNGIPNNPEIIKTSAPIGIALLLGLLFKYTPLWRVLTKKNRKKGAGINEGLYSVLQEPSIMDDERSIPFSYGAFEYSSFNQNSY
ncbi:VIR protein [Plasmodium vivax]|uniref:VIR protein n=2 Tax=Plasmodium vivax TaxID=5855 RepID=A0A1G4E5P9_PLAVI|nr:hypothetical protein PVNG_06414 [Plasmodium vivax North Korean]SCA82141.1 VIR protein [Plasmodium vivax]